MDVSAGFTGCKQPGAIGALVGGNIAGESAAIGRSVIETEPNADGTAGEKRFYNRPHDGIGRYCSK